MKNQVQILITNLEPKRLFDIGYLDIEKVDLIINDKLEISYDTYKGRIQRMSTFDKRQKVVVVNLRIRNAQ